MNPQVFHTVSRNGRTYGVPHELHTMALFYNRKHVEAVLNPPKPAEKPEDNKDSKDEKDSSKKPVEEKKGKGADDDPREFLEKEPIVLAQNYPPQGGYYYQPREEEGRGRSSRRAQQEVQESYGYSQQQQQQPPPNQRRGNFWGYPQGQAPPGYGQPQQGYYLNQQPQLYAPPDEDALNRRRRATGTPSAAEGPDSAAPNTEKRRTRSRRDETSPTESAPVVNDDVLTTEAESALASEQTKTVEHVTSTIQTRGLPSNWDQFIRLAVKLTDHQSGRAGYGPTLLSKEGGREFAQWGIQTGLNIQTMNGPLATIDVNTSAAADVVQFLKDLHWRFDVTPPPKACYYDNLMRQFAEGKLAMMMMPADSDTISQLVKLGMAVDDIGIAALPRGPENRAHLTYGKCLIVNSQLDRQRREAAFRWLVFLASPEVQRLRLQFFFRELEETGAPSVPLYVPPVQEQFYEETKRFRSLPIYRDYEDAVGNTLRLEPPLHTDRLFEAIATGVFPMIEREDSDPLMQIVNVAADFESRYLRPPEQLEGWRAALEQVQTNVSSAVETVRETFKPPPPEETPE